MAGFTRRRRVGMAISTHGLLLLIGQGAVERIAEPCRQSLDMSIMFASPIRIARTNAAWPVVGIADRRIVATVAAETGTDDRRSGDAVDCPAGVAEVENTRDMTGRTVTRGGVVGRAGTVNFDSAVTVPAGAAGRQPIVSDPGKGVDRVLKGMALVTLVVGAAIAVRAPGIGRCPVNDTGIPATHPVTMATATGGTVGRIVTGGRVPLVRPVIAERNMTTGIAAGSGIISGRRVESCQPHGGFVAGDRAVGAEDAVGMGTLCV